MAIQGNFSTAILSLVEDLTSADKVNINEAIFQETFGISDFVKAHTLRTGVRDGSVIPIVLNGDDYCTMPSGDESSCSLNTCAPNEVYDAKKWSLGEYNCRIPICLRTLDENFLVFWNMYRQRLDGPLAQPDTSAYLDFLTEQVRRNVAGAMWRVGYWGDTTSANPLIDANDGFFLQAELGSGVKAPITAVDPSEPTGQEILDSIFEELDKAYNQYWLGSSDVVIKMSWAAAHKIVAYLNSLDKLGMYNCTCVDPNKLVASNKFTVEGLRISGIPVEAHREIDGSATCVEDAGVYQVLIARKSNLLVGTNTQEKMEMFDIFFDKMSKNIYLEAMIYLGVSIPLDEYIFLSSNVGS